MKLNMSSLVHVVEATHRLIAVLIRMSQPMRQASECMDTHQDMHRLMDAMDVIMVHMHMLLLIGYKAED